MKTDREKIISILSEVPFEEGTTWDNVYAMMADRLIKEGFQRVVKKYSCEHCGSNLRNSKCPHGCDIQKEWS